MYGPRELFVPPFRRSTPEKFRFANQRHKFPYVPRKHPFLNIHVPTRRTRTKYRVQHVILEQLTGVDRKTTSQRLH